jgi:TatA/E family protein of Tat protein translocase
MFGLGVWEIAVIAVVALLVLGPDKLPSAAKSLGKALRDFRRAGDDIKQQMLGELDEMPRPKPPMAVHTPPENMARDAAATTPDQQKAPDAPADPNGKPAG